MCSRSSICSSSEPDLALELLDDLLLGEKPEEKGRGKKIELNNHRDGGRNERLEKSCLPFLLWKHVFVRLTCLDDTSLRTRSVASAPQGGINLVEAQVVGHHQPAGDIFDFIPALGAGHEKTKDDLISIHWYVLRSSQ
jgi:hypothetical protein